MENQKNFFVPSPIPNGTTQKIVGGLVVACAAAAVFHYWSQKETPII